MNVNILKMLAPLALLAGCAKTAAPEYSWTTDPNAVIVKASVGTLTRSNPLGGEDEQKKFNPGDVISIWQVSRGDSFDYRLEEGGNWVPVDNSKYMVWPSSKKDKFGACYQPRACLELVTDQSTLAGLASADFMMTTGIEGDNTSGDNKLSFTLDRQFSLVTVKIAGYNDQYDPETDKISDLKIYLTNAAYVDAKAVTPYVRNASGQNVANSDGTKGWTYSAIGTSPFNNADKAVFIEFKMAGKTETFTGIPTLEAGKSYIFNLTVGKNKIELGDVTVLDWDENVDLGGDNDEYEAEKK